MNQIDHVFVTSDHHFGSAASSLSFMRTFTFEQERELIAKWNAVVGPDDLVYYNGDFSDVKTLLELAEYRRQLNGRIGLIRGNHDVLGDEVYKLVFDDVVDEVVLEDLDLVIHHCPGDAKGHREIFGHEHRGMTSSIRRPNAFCSCVQFHDGYPVSLERVLESFGMGTDPTRR